MMLTTAIQRWTQTSQESDSLSSAFMALAKAESSIARFYDAQARALVIIFVIVLALIFIKIAIMLLQCRREGTNQKTGVQ